MRERAGEEVRNQVLILKAAQFRVWNMARQRTKVFAAWKAVARLSCELKECRRLDTLSQVW